MGLSKYDKVQLIKNMKGGYSKEPHLKKIEQEHDRLAVKHNKKVESRKYIIQQTMKKVITERRKT